MLAFLYFVQMIINLPKMLVISWNNMHTHKIVVKISRRNSDEAPEVISKVIPKSSKIFWLASIGDSFSSGQGNPDVPVTDGKPAKWLNESCYRSSKAFPYQVSKKLANSTVLSFFSCSGATVDNGILSKNGQLEALEKMIKTRGDAPNALLLTVGGNDIGFTDIISLMQRGSSLESSFDMRFFYVSHQIDRVASKIKELNITRVILLDYYDVTRNEKGVVDASCGALGQVSLANLQLAQRKLLQRLNKLLLKKATQHGWITVDSSEIFRTHGICSTSPLIRSPNESLAIQGNEYGSFHPNEEAHRRISEAIDLLRNKKATAFQLESSQELEKSMSCERYPYKSICNNNSTENSSQPQAKWYFDLQTLSCELYPLGMCEDDPLENLALRTRDECEERCDVAKVKIALEKLSDGNSIEPTLYHFSRFPVRPVQNAQIAQIAIDDVVQESKHIRGRPFAVEPPTDLFHVIHVPSDAHVLRNSRKNRMENQVEIDENQLLTTDSSDEKIPENLAESQKFSTVTSDILHVLEDANDAPEAAEHSEGSGFLEKDEGSITLTVSTEPATSPEIPTEILEDELLSSSESVTEKREDRTTSLKSMENSFERFYQRNKEAVVCAQTAYRLVCPSGNPSQFVYRWEKVDGVCQSFPYGYCLHEKNSAHPRTRAECEQFC
ncbi:unnamed protein product [Caenorhabditis sp. 36 PRJEB53466]|nr:unnamed protein product [Caenorhabditis sp. 36 PRJEB53466]